MTQKNEKPFDRDAFQAALNKCTEFMRRKEKIDAVSSLDEKNGSNAAEKKSFFSKLKEKIASFPKEKLLKIALTAAISTVVYTACTTYAPGLAQFLFSDVLSGISQINSPFLSEFIQGVKEVGSHVIDFLKMPIGDLTMGGFSLAFASRCSGGLAASLYRHVMDGKNTTSEKKAELNNELTFQLNNQMDFNNKISQCLEPVKEMITHPEAFNIKDVDGNTIIDYALAMKNIKMLHLLKSAGADFEQPTKSGLIPKDEFEKLVFNMKCAENKMTIQTKKAQFMAQQAKAAHVKNVETTSEQGVSNPPIQRADKTKSEKREKKACERKMFIRGLCKEQPVYA